MRTFLGLLLVMVLCDVPLATAVTIDVVGGKLHAAFDVDVNGTLYDVEFIDGTCVEVYGTCLTSAFPLALSLIGKPLMPATFPDFSSVTGTAMIALRDQIFNSPVLAMFDTDPF